MKRLLGTLVVATGLSTAQASTLIETPRRAAPLPVKLAAAPSQGPPKLLALTPTAQHQAVYRFIESRVGRRTAQRLTPIIVAKANKYGLPPLLVAKVINRESTFRTHVSLYRCYGLMQVAYFHFKAGENPYDAATNVDAGCRVLSKYYGRFRNWPQALTAYNFGPSATVSRGLGTSRYARQVLAGR